MIGEQIKLIIVSLCLKHCWRISEMYYGNKHCCRVLRNNLTSNF